MPAPAGSDVARPVTEFRVRLSGGLSAVVTARPDAPLPRPAVAPPQPQPAPSPPAAPVPTPVAAAPQPDPVEELRQELAADRERIESVLDTIRRQFNDYRTSQATRVREMQRVGVELAMTIATRLLHERVASGDFPIEAKVRDMVAQFDNDVPLEVHLNPADVELLEARLGGEPLLAGAADPRVVPDRTLARGECRLEGREGMLVSDLGRELQEIRDELLGSIAHARS